MKVIFLDIDGVLNSNSTSNPRKFPYVIDDMLLARFRELVRKTGATVVLSSTWRVDPIGLLAAKYYQVPYNDACPDMPGAPRCEEMQAWLRHHPEATRYAVLDDDDDCLDELPLFQPSSKTGLTEEIAHGIEESWRDVVIKTCELAQLSGWVRIFIRFSDETKASFWLVEAQLSKKTAVGCFLGDAVASVGSAPSILEFSHQRCSEFKKCLEIETKKGPKRKTASLWKC